MNDGETFMIEIKHFLSERNRKGGELILIKREYFSNRYGLGLRCYMTSEVLEFVGRQNYCYIADESTNDTLLFLDVSRGIKYSNNFIYVLGYFYEKGHVVSYVIDKYLKKQE